MNGTAQERVVFVGDGSIASGRWQEWFPEFEVVNLGVTGATSDDVAARLDAVVQEQPHSVVVAVGSNDFVLRRSATEYVVRNIENFLWELRHGLPGARTLVQSILPRGHEFADQIRDANRHLRQFCPSLNAQYLDLWPALALDDGELNPAYSDDRSHLNEQGYQAWLAELRPAFERLLDAPPMSRPISIIPPVAL